MRGGHYRAGVDGVREALEEGLEEAGLAAAEVLHAGLLLLVELGLHLEDLLLALLASLVGEDGAALHVLELLEALLEVLLAPLEVGGDLGLAGLEGVAHGGVLRHLDDDDVGVEVAQLGSLGVQPGGGAEGQQHQGEEAERAGQRLEGHADTGWA